MVKEVRAARDRGQIVARGNPDFANARSPGNRPATLAEIGVDRRRVLEWRLLATVGCEWIERQICLALLAGRAPTPGR
jgi:hypothetical protein